MALAITGAIVGELPTGAQAGIGLNAGLSAAAGGRRRSAHSLSVKLNRSEQKKQRGSLHFRAPLRNYVIDFSDRSPDREARDQAP